MVELPAKSKVRKRIVYLDYLRALAIITVILFHVGKRMDFAIVMDYAAMPSVNWFINDFLIVCCRCGVDIFLMLSGALSLGRKWDIKSFLGKRIPRIVIPFIFWGAVLCIVIWVLDSYAGINMVFSKYYMGVIHTNGIWSFLDFLSNSLTGHNKWFGPYWFFWMILGTYLIMPIFNKWIYHSDMKEVEYFLVIWLVTCIFSMSFLNFEFPIKLTYFTGPIGMVVLGYYLRHTDREIFKNIWFSILLIVIGGVSAMYFSYANSTPAEMYYMSRYSICLAVEVIGIFLLFKNIDSMKINALVGEGSILRKTSFSIAKYSYGIYLVHQFVMNILMVLLIPFVNYKGLIVLLSIGTLVFSWGILALLNRVPFMGNIIGSK